MSGAKACKSCRSRQELSNEYLLAKSGFDTAGNEPLKVCQKLVTSKLVRITVRKKHRLNDANTALLDAVEQRSADLLREASHFARDGISQTNVMKQQMILVESAMDEAESTLAEILSAEKALI